MEIWKQGHARFLIGHFQFLWRLPLTTRSQTSVPRSPFPVFRFSKGMLQVLVKLLDNIIFLNEAKVHVCVRIR